MPHMSLDLLSELFSVALANGDPIRSPCQTQALESDPGSQRLLRCREGKHDSNHRSQVFANGRHSRRQSPVFSAWRTGTSSSTLHRTPRDVWSWRGPFTASVGRLSRKHEATASYWLRSKCTLHRPGLQSFSD